ncbi:hypothetical protein, partial [Ruminococcus flavefaciens]|uniref:hypothetical protein n=1 Tax=Ruminococcus flavefaciens TaxID=1265 RepID=UPI002A912E5F
EDQQLQCRRSPTCGTKDFNWAGSPRCLTPAYPRFWVFSDCTFLDNSTFLQNYHVFILLRYTEYSATFQGFKCYIIS